MLDQSGRHGHEHRNTFCRWLAIKREIYEQHLHRKFFQHLDTRHHPKRRKQLNTVLVCGFGFALFIVVFIALQLLQLLSIKSPEPSVSLVVLDAPPSPIDTRSLAIVCPFHSGDAAQMVESLTVGWATTCSRNGGPNSRNIDLVLYFSGWRTNDTRIGEVVHTLAGVLEGNCFRTVKIAYADLLPEEDIYPLGPTLQFYKMYLDEKVSMQFAEYGVFALLEWDVTLLDPNAFEILWRSAYVSDTYWMKGATLKGDTFHESAKYTKYWSMLGHINGNALYNLRDPEFKDFIAYTKKRHPPHAVSYDVAMWLTIASFPYSWLFWQRYASKFHHTDVMMNAGVNMEAKDMHRQILSSGGIVAGTGGPSLIHVRLRDKGRFCADPPVEKPVARVCPDATSGDGKLQFVYDETCANGEEQRWNGFNCKASCRLCYVKGEERAAREADVALAARHAAQVQRGEISGCYMVPHVIMCDTLMPPPAEECNPECAYEQDSICDSRCLGPDPPYTCGFRGLGQSCRYCFTTYARAGGTVHHGQTTSVMCDTFEPPIVDECWEELEKAWQMDGNNMLIKEKSIQGSGTISRKLLESDRKKPTQTEPTLDDEVDDICVFIRGDQGKTSYLVQMIDSVTQHMPDALVVVATNPAGVAPLTSELVGHKVVVKETTDVRIAGLYADQMCEGRSLIYYAPSHSMLIRPIYGKDVYDASGRVLVPWMDPRYIEDYYQKRSELDTARLIGWWAPVFTYGQQVILPAVVNKLTRELLQRRFMLEPHKLYTLLKESPQLDVVQIMCAHAYGRPPAATPMRFYNAGDWTRRHLLVANVSVWDIPVLKASFAGWIT